MEGDQPTKSNQIDAQVSVASNFTLCCEDLINWINLVDLKKEQIISISASETSTIDADAVLILTYRTEKEPSMTSLKEIKFNLLKNVVDWDEQYNQLQESHKNEKIEVISLTHTARNIGQINIQILWYLTSENKIQYTNKHFQNTGDLLALLSEGLAYLNSHVAPHNLVSFSVFEDDHPCPKQQYHLVIYHQGEGIAPLVRHPEVQGEIYSIDTISNRAWEDAVDKSIKLMESKGTSEYKFSTSSYNYSVDDQKQIAVIRWLKVHEDLLADHSRGMCNCTIF